MKQLIWLALSCVALVATSVASILISGLDLPSLSNKLTQPVAVLIGGLVGLSGIAYQTNKGFKNLIASQEHRAAIERDARLHLHELAANERLEKDRVKSERLIAAIMGELESLELRYRDLAIGLERSGALYKERETRNVPFRKQSINISRLQTPIIDACIPEMHVIDAPIVRDICMLYAKILYELKAEDMADYDVFYSVYGNFSRIYRELEHECRQLIDVLHIFISRSEYTGPIKVAYGLERVSDKNE
jgi:hypothetical protein